MPGQVSLIDEVFLPLASNTPFDARMYSNIEFQFTAPGPVTVMRSLDGISFFPWVVRDGSYVATATAVNPGIWSTDGNGWVRFSVDVTLRAEG
jgi:hypothetical protein